MEFNLVLLFYINPQGTLSEMASWGPKNCRSKIFPFLYSLGHTEAKKIPEYFFHWYHLACFFQMKILKKFFLAKTHQKGPKIGCSQKKFFAKWPEKHLENFTHIAKICSKCSSGHFAKIFFFGYNQFLDLPDEF